MANLIKQFGRLVGHGSPLESRNEIEVDVKNVSSIVAGVNL
jgi:hypothetical protein